VSAQPLDSRVARLEGAYEQVDKRLDSIDRRLETLDRKIDTLRTETMAGFGRVQWQMTSLILGTWITVMLTLFFHRL